VKTRQSFFHNAKKILKGQQGFSLAEVMVAAGMLGVLSLGVTQLMQNSKKTEKRFGQQMNLYALDEEIRESLENSTACGRTFLGSDIMGAAPAALNTGAWTALPDNQIYNGVNPNAGVTKANWGTTLRLWTAGGEGVYGNGSNTVSVRNIQYRAFLDEGTLTDSQYGVATYGNGFRTAIGTSTDFYGKVVIRIEFTRGNYASYVGLANDQLRQERSNKVVSGPFRVTRFYPVTVRVNAGNQVMSCFADANQITRAYCDSLGGTFDDALGGSGRCTQIEVHDSPTEGGVNFAITATDELGGSASILAQGGLQVGGARTDAPPTGGDILGQGDIRILGTANLGTNAQLTTPAAAAGDVAVGDDLRVYRTFGVGSDAQLAGASVTRGDARIGRSLEVQRSFNVGSPATPATAAGDASIRRNLRTEGTSTTVGGHFAESYSHVGAPAAASTASGNLTVENVTRSGSFHVYQTAGANNVTIGQAAADTTNRLRVSAGRAFFTTTNTGATGSSLTVNNSVNGSQIQLNHTASNPVRINNNGTRVLTVGSDGRITVSGPTGGNKIVIGAGTGNYRPLYINNQPSGTGSTAATGVVGTEAATKAWVKNMIYGTQYSEADIANITQNILDYAQHHTIDVLERGMCESIRTKLTGTPNSTYRACSWIAATNLCECQITQSVNNCSDDTLTNGTRVCNDIYLSNRLNALGSITAGGNIQGVNITATDYSRAQRLYTQVSGVALPPVGYIRGNFMESRYDTISNRDVLATRDLIAGRAGSESKVCSRSGGVYYCYTKFGKFTCRGGATMIGIAHGHPICARMGGSWSGEGNIQVDRR
jgi:type II secretory pathway pseudopilin PulG